MKKQQIAILGVSGMLGSMVLDVFYAEKDFSILSTLRDTKEMASLKKKYPNAKFAILNVDGATPEVIAKTLKGSSWVINCIGIIKPYIHDDNALEVARAIRVNSLFPYNLGLAAKKIKAGVLQIETDCVFSGKKGNYLETDEHDALDAYGKSKSLGEVKMDNVFHLRDSIIGPELSAHVSLLDWFLGQKKNAKVNGFSNHKWNGITTYHFAKICVGIIKTNLKLESLQHIISVDKPSKAQMLKYFAKYFHREDISITFVKAPKVINRTLKTIKPKLNKKIWASAGYKNPPTVREMIKELSEYLDNSKIKNPAYR